MKSFIPPLKPLQTALQPFAEAVGLKALPLHVHEILLSFGFYHIIFEHIAPRLSTLVIPRRYKRFNRKEKLNWNLQCVSLVQSILICGVALCVIFNDDARNETTPEMRVWGYSGAAGAVQSFATGYFLWDLIVTMRNLESLGLPVLIHAFSCLVVYMLGFVSLAIHKLLISQESTAQSLIGQRNLFSTTTAACLSYLNFQLHSSTSIGSRTSSA